MSQAPNPAREDSFIPMLKQMVSDAEDRAYGPTTKPCRPALMKAILAFLRARVIRDYINCDEWLRLERRMTKAFITERRKRKR